MGIDYSSDSGGMEVFIDWHEDHATDPLTKDCNGHSSTSDDDQWDKHTLLSSSISFSTVYRAIKTWQSIGQIETEWWNSKIDKNVQQDDDVHTARSTKASITVTEQFKSNLAVNFNAFVLLILDNTFLLLWSFNLTFIVVIWLNIIINIQHILRNSCFVLDNVIKFFFLYSLEEVLGWFVGQ
jgi:hypothetical protein